MTEKYDSILSSVNGSIIVQVMPGMISGVKPILPQQMYILGGMLSLVHVVVMYDGVLMLGGEVMLLVGHLK